MGAWGIGLFENDTASDAIWRYRDSEKPMELMVEDLHTVEYKPENKTAFEDMYIELDETSDVIVQALMVLATANGTEAFKSDFGINDMIIGYYHDIVPKAKPALDAAYLEQFAVSDTEKVGLVKFLVLKLELSIGNEKTSELLELWTEVNEADAWKKTIEPIIKCLKELKNE